MALRIAPSNIMFALRSDTYTGILIFEKASLWFDGNDKLIELSRSFLVVSVVWFC